AHDRANTLRRPCSADARQCKSGNCPRDSREGITSGKFLALRGASALFELESAILENTMIDRKVWFVTGASRGMGVDIVKAALSAGHAVVATGRKTATVTKALGTPSDLVVLKL